MKHQEHRTRKAYDWSSTSLMEGYESQDNQPSTRLGLWFHHMLYHRWVRKTLYWLRHRMIPGSEGVPIYVVMRYFFAGISNGVLWQRAKGMSYSFLMALPPLLIFFFSLIAYFPVDGLQDELLFQLRGILPPTIYDYIATTVNDIMGHKHGNLLSIGFATAIILATNGMHGLLMSFNFANKSVETRPFLQRYGVCLMLVFMLFIMVALVLLLFLGYKLFIHYLVDNQIVGKNALIFVAINIGRWLLIVAFLLILISFIYYWAPAKKQRVGFLSPGAVVATAGFILLSWAFQVYFNNFNRYNIIYGSIGTILVVMLWLYFNCLVLLVGYEINTAILNGRRSRDAMRLLKMTSAEEVTAHEAGREATEEELERGMSRHWRRRREHMRSLIQRQKAQKHTNTES